MAERKCTRCGVALVIGSTKRCERCKKKARDDYANDPAWKERARTQKQLENHWAKNLLRYGITPEQYEEMWERQQGQCAICKINMVRGTRAAVGVTIDHCHETNQVRGLLCGNCNRGLGCFYDNPDALQAAIAYLERTSVVSQ